MKTVNEPSVEPNTDFGAYLQKLIDRDPAIAEMVAEEETQLCIAEEIYRLRKEKGYTQAQLAKKTGTTQSVIARMENADYDGHSLKMLQKLASALDVRLGVGFFAKRVGSDSLVIRQELDDVSAWPVVVPTTVD